MSFLGHPLKITEIFSFTWTGIRLFADDVFRYFHREEITVRIKSGQVKGYKIASNSNYQNYWNFIGIPYAKPPTGELRFKEPQQFEASNDVINEKFGRHGSLAHQLNPLFPNRTVGSEDCLHLSVFTHDIQPNALVPCMVWIHGGAFTFGSNSTYTTNPEFLLRKKIVLIKINYRLGAFGFVSFKDPELNVPGNAGLKDQVMALKWVKENCMHFGGDPDNITIFGESAGAASVSMHLLSNRSKDLFHKAIIMSGSAYAPWALSSGEGNWPQRLAKKLGWNGDGGELACLKVLQNATPHAIIQASDKLMTIDDCKQFQFIPFAPVLESYETTQCFLNKYPSQLIDSAWSKHIPIIVGACANEGLLFYKMLKNMPDVLERFSVLTVLPLQELDLTAIQTDKCQKVNEQLEHFYHEQSKKTITTLPSQNSLTLDYFMILHDKAFAHPIHRLIMSRNQHQHAPTYLLRFDFESTYSKSKRIFVGENIPGVCHGDDLSYYYRTLSPGRNPEQHTDEWKTIERMCAIFTAFATNGDPNNPVIAPIDWKPIAIASVNDQSHIDYNALNVSNDVNYTQWIDSERMQYWDQIYQQLKIE